MSEITVTMPLKEYESMKKEIDTLKQNNIYRFIRREFTDIERNEFNIEIDLDGIRKMLSEQYPVNKIYIKE